MWLLVRWYLWVGLVLSVAYFSSLAYLLLRMRDAFGESFAAAVSNSPGLLTSWAVIGISRLVIWFPDLVLWMLYGQTHFGNWLAPGFFIQ